MVTIITAIHIVVCLFLVGIVLLQHGKGADIGATFGGSSQSLFGTEGPIPLMNKVTTTMAVVFMLTSIALAFFSAHRGTGSVMIDAGQPLPVPPVERALPAVPIEENIPMPSGATDEAVPFEQAEPGQSSIPMEEGAPAARVELPPVEDVIPTPEQAVQAAQEKMPTQESAPVEAGSKTE